MYPANFYSLFPAFPRLDTCFVAMSFAKQFEFRWQHVIAPAIASITFNGKALQPVRVDQRTINDSILTEILNGIGQCRVVFADVTSLGSLDGRAMRNGNVMYEIGIAHAVRSPAEVVLFRSDADALLFDVANVRVNTYEPDKSAPDAFVKVQQAILTSLREVDLLQTLAVQQAAGRLDLMSWEVLGKLAAGPALVEPTLFETMALGRLLDNGLVTIEYVKATEEKLTQVPDLNKRHFVQYRLTQLGGAVHDLILKTGDYSAAEPRLKAIQASAVSASTIATQPSS